ncbi:hypothetical protein JOB18_036987 [Solea senegalensis]|uniref:Uncharacterized protein n=1 Tax=Solea senegalensis TaxID=28829 RepID=A0AAV6Q4M9_SOLSE|nr:hypothetical protein JOB18_036987 [Solea senegalensis]
MARGLSSKWGEEQLSNSAGWGKHRCSSVTEDEWIFSRCSSSSPHNDSEWKHAVRCRQRPAALLTKATAQLVLLKNSTWNSFVPWGCELVRWLLQRAFTGMDPSGVIL